VTIPGTRALHRIIVLFTNFVSKFTDMATIVIKLGPKANQSKLIEAIEMLKGVKSVTVAGDPVSDDDFLVNQMTASRKSGKGDKKKVMEFLSK
jgi:hypothetical protein